MIDPRVFGSTNKVSETAKTNQEAKNAAERKALMDAINKPQPIAAATRLTAKSISRKQNISIPKPAAKPGVFKSGSSKISAKPVRSSDDKLSLQDSAEINDDENAASVSDGAAISENPDTFLDELV